jgi:hypothetical protein
MTLPNRREWELAKTSSGETLEALVAYREELLKPFDELRDECRALRDTSMEKRLAQIINMLRGEP